MLHSLGCQTSLIWPNIGMSLENEVRAEPSASPHACVLLCTSHMSHPAGRHKCRDIRFASSGLCRILHAVELSLFYRDKLRRSPARERAPLDSGRSGRGRRTGDPKGQSHQSVYGPSLESGLSTHDLVRITSVGTPALAQRENSCSGRILLRSRTGKLAFGST